MDNNNPTPTPTPAPTPTPTPSPNNQKSSGMDALVDLVEDTEPQSEYPSPQPGPGPEDNLYTVNQPDRVSRIGEVCYDSSKKVYYIKLKNGKKYSLGSSKKHLEENLNRTLDELYKRPDVNITYLNGDATISSFGEVKEINGKYYLIGKDGKGIYLGDSPDVLTVDNIIDKIVEQYEETQDNKPNNNYNYGGIKVKDGRYAENSNIAYKPCISIEDSNKYYELIDGIKGKIIDQVSIASTAISSAISALPEEDSGDICSLNDELTELEHLSEDAEKLTDQINICVSIYEYCDNGLKAFLDSYLIDEIFGDNFDKEKWSANMEHDVGEIVDGIIEEVQNEVNELYDFLKDGYFISEEDWKFIFGKNGEGELGALADLQNNRLWIASVQKKYGNEVAKNLLELSRMALQAVNYNYVKPTVKYDADGNPVKGYCFQPGGDLEKLYKTILGGSQTPPYDKFISERTANSFLTAYTKYNAVLTNYNSLKETLEAAKNFKKQLPYLQYATTDEYKETKRNLLKGFVKDKYGNTVKVEFDSNGNIINSGEIAKILGLDHADLVTPEELAMAAYLNNNVNDKLGNYTAILNNLGKSRKAKKDAIDAISAMIKNGLDPFDYLANLGWGSAKALEDYVMGFAKLAAPEIGLTVSDYLKDYYTEFYHDYAYREITQDEYKDIYQRYLNGEISYNEYVLRNSICNSIISGKFSSTMFGLLGESYDLMYDVTSTAIPLVMTVVTYNAGVGWLGVLLNAASKGGTAAGKAYQSSYDKDQNYWLSLGRGYAVGMLKTGYEFLKYSLINEILYGGSKLEKTWNEEKAIEEWVKKVTREGYVDIPKGGVLTTLWYTYLKGRLTDATMEPVSILYSYLEKWISGDTFSLDTLDKAAGEELKKYTEGEIAMGLYKITQDLEAGKTLEEIIEDAKKTGNVEVNLIKVLVGLIAKKKS